MCPVGYLRRGVVDTTNACYPVGDTVCNLYTIYKRSRARSSAHLTVAVFCPDWLLLWMWGRQCGQCPIFSLPPFAPTVQLAHSVCKQISSSLVLPLWFPCMFCFFPSSYMDQVINVESKCARINRLSTLCIPCRQYRLWNVFSFS